MESLGDVVRFTLAIGKRTITWEIDEMDDDIVDVLADIVSAVNPEQAAPAAYIEPAVGIKPTTVVAPWMKDQVPKVAGARWDDDTAVDDLPIM